MKRRDFLTAASFAGMAPLATTLFAQESTPPGRQVIELRRYAVADQAKRDALDTFFRDAAIPAWNRLGIAPVGVLVPADGVVGDVFVVLPHPSAESVVAATNRLMADTAFLQAGKAVVEAPFNDPVYTQLESSLLLAFATMPQLATPVKSPDRLYQLRIYQSHALGKAAKKIAMFEQGGEIEIFRRTGLNPVFFGQAIAGAKLPNLTYMVGFDNQAALDQAWAAFRADPAWLALKDQPEYKDTVSTITNLILRPTAASQM